MTIPARQVFPEAWAYINTHSPAEISNGVTPIDYSYPAGNIRRYGAVPGGSDSSAAFVAAAAASDTVYVPDGNYKLAPGVLAFSKPIRIVGNGRSSTTITSTGTGGDLISWSGNSNIGGGIESITINATSMASGIVLKNVAQARWLVSDIQIYGGYNGIYIEDQNLSMLRNLFMYGQTGQYSIKNYGTGVAACAVLSIETCAVGYATCTAASPVGLLLDGDCATIDVRYMSVVNGYRGLSIVNTPGFPYGPQFFTGYDFQVDQSYDAGIYIDGGAGVTMSHRFTDLYQHYSHTSHGIQLTSTATDCSFQSGVVISNYKNGILNGGLFTKMVDLQIAINSNAAAGTYPSIQLASTSIGAIVSNCLAGTWTGSAVANTNYGVQIDAGATAYTIIGNNLNGNTVAPYLDSAHDISSTIFGNSQSSVYPHIVSAPVRSQDGQNLSLKCANGWQVVLGDVVNGSSFAATAQANAVNYPVSFGVATGQAPAFQAAGTDTDIHLKLLGKGTGTIQFGSSASWTANGAVATAFTGLGPTGSRTTIQKWLTVKDNGGNTYYIPAF